MHVLAKADSGNAGWQPDLSLSPGAKPTTKRTGRVG
jgi:hypothetical protein